MYTNTAEVKHSEYMLSFVHVNVREASDMTCQIPRTLNQGFFTCHLHWEHWEPPEKMKGDSFLKMFDCTIAL